jgi:hypothetical protein
VQKKLWIAPLVKLEDSLKPRQAVKQLLRGDLALITSITKRQIVQYPDSYYRNARIAPLIHEGLACEVLDIPAQQS